VDQEFSLAAVGVCNCGFQGFNFIEEHQYIGGVYRCRGCRIGHQHYLIVAVDPCKCKGWLGNLCYIVDEPIELVEGIISPFLQFGRWKNSVGRDNGFLLDVR
jgi:hypothetical protein